MPLYAVNNLIEERQARQNEVLADFQRSWGPSQTISGPILAVTYVEAAKHDNAPPLSPPQRHGWVQIPNS
jgi:inner membrane protein involved in colicin E2 resistance